MAPQRIAVDVDVLEGVVGPDLLQLPEGLLERLPVPKADVVDGVLVRLDVRHRQRRVRVVGANVDPIEAEGYAGEVDVALEVGLLERQLVGLDHEALDRDRQHHPDHQHRAEKAAGEREHEARPAGRDHRIGGEREQDRQQRRTPEREPGDVDRGVAGAEHRPRRRGQKTVAVEHVARGPGEQEQDGVGQHVVEHGPGRHDPDPRAVADQPRPAVGDEQHRGRREGEHRDRVLDPVEERQLEQIEADVAPVERVGLAERLRPEEADEGIPALGEADADDQRRPERGQELERPDQPGWRQARDLRRRARRLERADQVDPAREQPEIDPGVDEHDAGRGREQTELDREQAPEDPRIADRLKPEQIGKPAKREQRQGQERDQEPEDPGGGEEAHEAAHEASAGFPVNGHRAAGGGPDPSEPRSSARPGHHPTDRYRPLVSLPPTTTAPASVGPRRRRPGGWGMVDAEGGSGCPESPADRRSDDP